MLPMANNQANMLATGGQRAFGERVSELRKAAGHTQGTLAKEMAHGDRTYSQSTVAKIENGTRPTSVGELYVLADILGVKVADFFAPLEGHGLVSEFLAAENKVELLRDKIALAEVERDQLLASLHSAQRDLELVQKRMEVLRKQDDGVDQ